MPSASKCYSCGREFTIKPQTGFIRCPAFFDSHGNEICGKCWTKDSLDQSKVDKEAENGL